MTVRPGRRWPIATGVALAASALLGLTLLSPQVTTTASSGPIPIHIAGTGEVGAVNIHTDSTTASTVLGAIPEGATPTYHCFKYGDNVNGVPIWFNVTYDGVAGYYTSYYDDAHYQSNAELTQKYGVPECGAEPGASPTGGKSDPSHRDCQGPAIVSNHFNGRAACEWAIQNAMEPPRFSDDDCTWFVSQALWAGGLPQTGDWTAASKNIFKLAIQKPNSSKGPFEVPGPTVTAANAPDLVDYLVNNHLASKTPIDWSDNTAHGAQLGDLIAYYWDKNVPVGSISHLAIVTGFSGTYPLVSQHTPPQKNRGWSWSNTKKYWIQYSSDVPNPEAFLIHIIA